VSTEDERRERYAAALHELLPGCTHDEHGSDCRPLADAALAVADEEKRQIMRDSATIAEKWADAQDEIARLREELKKRQRESADFDARVQRAMEDRMKECAELRATIERVREWAERTKDGAAAAAMLRILDRADG
jgi:septal ring factor EnvC (AmiA/AmiB activator)